jgi:hypothetical protein
LALEHVGKALVHWAWDVMDSQTPPKLPGIVNANGYVNGKADESTPPTGRHHWGSNGWLVAQSERTIESQPTHVNNGELSNCIKAINSQDKHQ